MDNQIFDSEWQRVAVDKCFNTPHDQLLDILGYTEKLERVQPQSVAERSVAYAQIQLSPQKPTGTKQEKQFLGILEAMDFAASKLGCLYFSDNSPIIRVVWYQEVS